MTYPRAHIVDSANPGFYHIISRCVRRARLCGVDEQTGISYEARRRWIERRMNFLAGLFSVELYAYAVMSNHYHMVVYIDPKASKRWTDAEVAKRWIALKPVRRDGQIDRALTDEKRRAILEDAEQIAAIRERLSNLSWFMRELNHPIACRANAEDDCTGHFWEGRFKSKALLDSEAIIACMAYVELNPLRAREVTSLDSARYTSLSQRSVHKDIDPTEFVKPVSGARTDGGTSSKLVAITQGEYWRLLETASVTTQAAHSDRWTQCVRSMGHPQRVHGLRASIDAWLTRVGQRWSRAIPLPD